ncbi:MAG: glycosyltransferase family protein [Bryobacteraceae bacterium]
MIVAAVQARMGSARLANKVLAEVAGRPMMWHIVNRLKFAKRVDQIVIAAAAGEANEPIRDFAEEYGIQYFAGSELDLIDRLHTLADTYDAEALVRVTADNPLVDPAVIDRLIEVYLSKRGSVDFVSNVLPQSYPHGLDAEVWAAATLKRLWHELDHPFWREWFPAYLGEHKESFRIINVTHSPDLTHYRWTVDYEEDLSFVREVFGRLYREGEVFGMHEVISLLEENPGLRDTNARHANHNSRQEGIRIAFESYTKAHAGQTNAERLNLNA